MATIAHLDTRHTGTGTATVGLLDFRPDARAWLAERETAARRRTDAVRSDEAVGPPAPAAGAAPSSPRRFAGRVLMGLGAVVLATAAWSLVGWLNGPGVGVEPVGADLTDAARATVVVEAGDTLWSIAAELEPDGDIRALVDRLAERNGGSALRVGQALVVGE